MKRILSLVLVLFFILPFVSAADPVIGKECASVSAFDYEAQTVCVLHSEILSQNKVMLDENRKLMDEVKSATDFEFDRENEKKDKIRDLMLYITASLFLFITVYTGYLYISSATYPEKREMAKVQLKSLVFIAIAIVASQPLINLAIDLGGYTTDYLYNSALIFNKGTDFNVETFDYGSVGDDYEKDLDRYSSLSSSSPMFQMSARAYTLSVRGRNMLLMTLMAFFPLIILMFFFQPAQEFGKFLLTLFLIEAFLPAFFVTILAISLSVLSGTDGVASMQVITSALFFAAFMHVVLVLLAIIKSAINTMHARRYLTSGGG